MNPPEPGPVSGLSVTAAANAAATQASTAFPPASSTCAPACTVSGCPADTAPLMTGSLAADNRGEPLRSTPGFHRLFMQEVQGLGILGHERVHMKLSRSRVIVSG